MSHRSPSTWRCRSACNWRACSAIRTTRHNQPVRSVISLPAAHWRTIRLCVWRWRSRRFQSPCARPEVSELTLPTDDWSAFNLGQAKAIARLSLGSTGWPRRPPAERARWRQRVENRTHRATRFGRLFRRASALRVPLVLAPITAHYSWSKGLKLLGLGRDQLELLPADGMRLDPAVLRTRSSVARASGSRYDVRGGAGQHRVRHHRPDP